MEARGSVRFSLSRYTTAEDVDHVLKHLPGIIARLRTMSPLNEMHPDNV
jgi:cysteine desulfurase